jgi:thiamine-phosphate pyrophosphorylase
MFWLRIFGPVFESISKPKYVSDIDFEKELKQRNNNKTELIALEELHLRESKLH